MTSTTRTETIVYTCHQCVCVYLRPVQLSEGCCLIRQYWSLWSMRRTCIFSVSLFWDALDKKKFTVQYNLNAKNIKMCVPVFPFVHPFPISSLLSQCTDWTEFLWFVFQAKVWDWPVIFSRLYINWFAVLHKRTFFSMCLILGWLEWSLIS